MTLFAESLSAPGFRHNGCEPSEVIEDPSLRLLVFRYGSARDHVADVASGLAIELRDVIKCALDTHLPLSKIGKLLKLLRSAPVILNLATDKVEDIKNKIFHLRTYGFMKT